MLSAPSQLLIRNQRLFEQGRWLLANPADAEIFTTFSQVDLWGFHQYFDIYQQARRLTSTDKHSFSAACTDADQFDGAVAYMPKAKDHAKMLLANLATVLKVGAPLLLVGENKGGIRGAAKLLAPFGAQVNKLDSARHCSLFATQVSKRPANFDLTHWQQTVTIETDKRNFQVVSLPGVFSHGELDPGTRLLLDNLANVPEGQLLDFGCGAGVVGCFLGLDNPKAKPVMSDINALALYCAEQSAKLNAIQAEVLASDGLSTISGKFAAVYTNPPFHTGIKTDYGITERFIQHVKNHLLAGGQLTLVANRFLKYPALIENHLGSVHTLAQSSKFSVYHSCL